MSARTQERPHLPGVPRLPIVTLLLILANLFGAFLLVWQPDLVETFGFSAHKPTILSAFTSLFLHQNVIHLLGNMVFLAAVGASLELATGHLRFVAVFFVGGFCGEAAHALAVHSAASSEPLIGASGCIAGCAGYYALRYAKLKVPLGPRVAAPVWTVALGWAVLQVTGAFVHFGDAGTTISYWAHLGGLLGGGLLNFLFRAPDLGQAKLDREALADIAGRGPSAEALAAQRHLERHPRDLEVWHQLAAALRTLGDHDDLAVALCRIYDLADEEERRQILQELHALGSLKRVPPLTRMEQAKAISGEDSALGGALFESLDEEPEAQFLLGELFLESDPQRSAHAFERLAKGWPEHAATRRAKARGWLKVPALEKGKTLEES
jgi:membrane associated rhomboid family serine protease